MEEIQMPNKHMKYAISLKIKEIQVKQDRVFSPLSH